MKANRLLFKTIVGGIAALLCCPLVVRGEFNTESDGSDGALDCAWLAAHDETDAYPDEFACATGCSPDDPATRTVDERCTFFVSLSKAISAAGTTWRTPGNGDGVYDARQWAVVYKFTTIEVPANVVIRFKNHPSGAPVVWLAQGLVEIRGELNLDGESWHVVSSWPSFSEPGPGGFAGGAPADYYLQRPAAGFGPGAQRSPVLESNLNACHAGWIGSAPVGGCTSGSSAYGREEAFPLIGGSGGGVEYAPGFTTAGDALGVGGAGGGAILIATNSEMHLPAGALIRVYGGGGWYALRPDGNPHCPGGFQQGFSGSSGAIRLVAGEELTSVATLGFYGFWGPCASHTGGGRLRIEAPVRTIPNYGTREQGVSISDTPGQVFPPDDAPTLELISVGGSAASHEPLAGPGTVDLEIDSEEPVQVVIRATNIPVGTRVKVSVVPLLGNSNEVQSTMLAMQPDGTLRATAMIPFLPGRSEIQLRANW